MVIVERHNGSLGRPATLWRIRCTCEPARAKGQHDSTFWRAGNHEVLSVKRDGHVVSPQAQFFNGHVITGGLKARDCQFGQEGIGHIPGDQ